MNPLQTPSGAPQSAAALSRVQVLLTSLVVASFLAAFAVPHARGAPAIARDVDGIVDSAMPSVALVSSARSDLHRLDTYVDAYADAAAQGLAIPVEPIERYRKAIDGALARYLALPSFPGERDVGSEIPAKLSSMDSAVSRVVSAVAAQDPVGARRAVEDEQRAAETCDVLLEHLVSLNAVQGQQLTHAIALERRWIIRTEMTLDCISVLLALAATTLAVVSLKRSVRSLELQTDELSHFAGRVAHDVLSPLQSVSFSLELMARRARSDLGAQKIADRGLSSARRVTRIVEGLLEFSRAGATPNPMAAADLKTTLEDVVDGLEVEAAAAHVDLELYALESCEVACSPGVLTSLAVNLVRNAIKHMDDAPIRRVDVRVVALGDRGRVEVVDTGPGIPPELGETIFEPFVHGDTRSSGMGLGLATVRRLADAHGGQAGFRSQTGTGSVFWFEIPAAWSRATSAGRPSPA